MTARVLLGLALMTGIGGLAVRVLAGKGCHFSRTELLSFAFGAGAGILSLSLFYLGCWGLPLSTRNIGLLAGSLVLLLWAMNGWKFLSRKSDGVTLDACARPLGCDPGTADHQRLRPHQKPETLDSEGSSKHLNRWLVGTIALAILLVFVDACSQPLRSFDARAIWAFKAKVIYHEQSLYGEAFLEAERLHAKTRYPQLVPLAEVFISHSVGSFAERAFKALFPMYYASLLLLVYLTLLRHFGQTYCLLATALFASLPVFLIYANGGVASGYADAPLAFYCTAFAVCLFRWLREPSGAAFRLSILFGALMAFTKNEGLALVGIGVTSAALSVCLRVAKPWRRLGALAILPLLAFGLLVPWFRYQAQLPAVEEDFFSLLTASNLLAGWERLPFILRAFLREFLFKPHLWNFLGLFVAAALVLSFRRAPGTGSSFFLWIPLLYMVQLMTIFMVIPWRLEELLPVSLTRLTLHTAPLLFLWVCFQLGHSRVLSLNWAGVDELRAGRARTQALSRS